MWSQNCSTSHPCQSVSETRMKTKYLFTKVCSSSVVWHLFITWYESLQSVLLCWFLNTHLSFFNGIFTSAGFTVCVSGSGVGGVSAQFLVWEFALRVIFLKKFYQWSYIYLKHLIVKHVFVLVIFEGKRNGKGTMWDLYVSHVWAGGDWTFHPQYLIFHFSFLSFFSSLILNESSSRLPFQIFHENAAHHHCH